LQKRQIKVAPNAPNAKINTMLKTESMAEFDE
jgi:hypothetical protein